MAVVIPALLEKDPVEIEKKIRRVETLVEWVQIDLADNTLVPNETFADPEFFKSLKTPVNLELHMMVSDPLTYLKPFADAGFKRFYAHVEAEHIKEFLVKAEELNVEVGLAIDAPTPLETIWPYLQDLDGVLVMAVKAGFSGQAFIPETADRVKRIADAFFDLPITVDGAMNDENAAKVVAAGASRINSNSFLFAAEDVRIPLGKIAVLGQSIRS
jgi:ribulose-phosphate 3-epimerase